MEPSPGSCSAATVCAKAAWKCGRRGLREVLRLVAAESGSGDGGDSEPGAEPVTLERPQTNIAEIPCVVYLQCSKQLAEIIFVKVVSEAKTMEVYTEEYCGTCQGQRVDNLQSSSDHKQVLFYKKYFKLDYPSSSCELKLLSLGGKEEVQIYEILLGIRYASVSNSRGTSPLGKNINLQRVQTMMDSMGTKLSPGAQQLLNMVQFQQKQNQAAIGGLFQGIFGTRNLTEIGKVIGSSLTTAQSEEGVISHDCIETNPTSISRLEETKKPEEIVTFNGESAATRGGSTLITGINKKKNVYDSEASTKGVDEQKFAGGDLKELISTYLCKQSNGEITFSSEMLPLLQNLCSQVNELRIGEKTKIIKKDAAVEDETCGRLYQQTFCFKLEKHITEHMESIEKRLKDYIDHRINILQDDLDKKFISLTKLIESDAVNRTATKSLECGAVLTNGGL